MKKLMSVLLCAALLVGVVVAVFPVMSGSADTAITTPGFTTAAPGTTAFKLGGADTKTEKTTLTVGEDGVYTYDLTQNLADWVTNTVYASDGSTPADLREFKWLCVNVTGLTNGYCTNAKGEYIDGNNKVVSDQGKAKYQAAFLAKLSLVDGKGNRLKKGTDDWNILGSDIRSKSSVRVDLEALRKAIEDDGKSVDDFLSATRMALLVYGKQVTVELYATNNDEFDPAATVSPEKNPTLSLKMSAGDKGTVEASGDGYYSVGAGSDGVALINLFTGSTAGNVDASAYPYLYLKFVMTSGGKVNSAVLVDAEGNTYKKDGADYNILGGAVEYGKQVKVDLSAMTDAEKAQFLTNLRIKASVEGSPAMVAKLSTNPDLKITTDNVPGVTAFKLTAKPGANTPGNATIVMDEETGSAKFQLGGHLAAWVPADMYYNNKRVNGNDYRYLVVNVKSLTDGYCRNDSDTSWAAEPEDANGVRHWVDVETQEEAKFQTGFVASFQLSYGNQQLKKVTLDAKGDLKYKSIREDAANFKSSKHEDKVAFETEVTVDGEKKMLKSYYLLDDTGKYMVDGNDWGVIGEARSPMRLAAVDFEKIASQIEESNAALDKGLKENKITQADHDNYYMDLEKVLENLTVRVLVYGTEAELEFYVTNNGNFTGEELTPDVYPTLEMGMSYGQEYVGNSKTADIYYYLKTNSNKIENKGGGATTLVANMYALPGPGNMDARQYDYLFLRVNGVADETKNATVSSIKLVDMEGNVLDQNLLGGTAVNGRTVRVDLRNLPADLRDQFLENTRLQIVMDGQASNVQAAVSTNPNFAFEDYTDEDDPNYAYKLHLQPLHIEFNMNDVKFNSDGSVSVNLSKNGAGMHVQDRNGAIDATEYKYMYVYVESGTIHDIRFRTSDNRGEDEMKVQNTYSASPGLTRINIEKLNKEKPRLMKDLCFNLVVYVNTEITGIWFSNSPTFDPIAIASESDYEVVIGQQVDPVDPKATMVMNLDGSIDLAGKGEVHFKPITGTKGYNASSLKYLVVDIASGAKNISEMRLRNKENNIAKSVTGLKDGLNYLVINELDESILNNIYFTFAVNGNAKISSMWFTNEPGLDPKYMATEPEYDEISLVDAAGYIPYADRESGEPSKSKLAVGDDGMVTVSGPKNEDVGLFALCYHDNYSNPPQSAYIKFGVVNRPVYVVAYTYDTTSQDMELMDVLTVNIQPGVYNDYVRIDLRDSSFYSKGFNGFLEYDIYAPATKDSGNGVAFTIDGIMFQGTGSPTLSPKARAEQMNFVGIDGAQFLKLSGYDWGDGFKAISLDGTEIVDVQTGEKTVVWPYVTLAVAGAAAGTLVVARRRRRAGARR
ncbi:MAG: hypothetical protein ACOYJY_01330 [Acutalibacteraceae bacterium]|jgi:hypothetical protein